MVAYWLAHFQVLHKLPIYLRSFGASSDFSDAYFLFMLFFFV